ncbi:MAG: hypothetical protein LBN29_06170 [Mediterranea sp.]|jgi:hypothetical protein|nr:hypothetical protein [Mediterranea sp.]
MKKIYSILFAALALAFTFAACSSEEPFSTATADDEPRILDPTFPDRANGALATFANINRDANLTMALTVTPADYTTVAWFIDGVEVPSGTASDKELDIALPAGTYTLKMVATTVSGKSTSREGIVLVNPLADDPQTTTVALERTVAPGQRGRLYGTNLAQVTGLLIGDTPATDLTYVEDESGSYIEYTVPETMADGDYRATLQDAGGNTYGADKVTVTSMPLVLAGASRATTGGAWTLTGINLDQVASITIGGQTVSEFSQQTATTLTLTCPELPVGDYPLTGSATGGAPVQFLVNGAAATEATVTVTAEQTLWEGHHYVSWDFPDGDPNKTFNLIPMDVFAGMAPGALLRVSYSPDPAAEYHQIALATGYWTYLLGPIDFSEAGVAELTLTQDMLDKIQAEAGFICVGHGYYVDLVTVK